MKPSYNLYKIASGAGSLFVFIQLLFSGLIIKSYITVAKKVSPVYERYELSEPNYILGFLLVSLLLMVTFFSIFSLIRMQRAINKVDKDRHLKYLMLFVFTGVLTLAANFAVTHELIISPIEDLPDIINRYTR
jgi:hypothetical protein